MGFLDTIIFLIFVGIAIYGVNCFAEKYQGKEITSEAEDIIDKLSSCYIKLCPFIPKLEKNMIRGIKPMIIEEALRIAYEDYEKNGNSSPIGVWMAARAESIKKSLTERNISFK